MDIAEKVCEVIRDFDQNFVGEITLELSLQEDLAWDSMDLVGIAECLIECFDLGDGAEADFVERITSMPTVLDLVAYVSARNPISYNRLVKGV